jgi:hypothetical protein
MSSRIARADVREFLEAAINDSNATLPQAPPNSSTSANVVNTSSMSNAEVTADSLAKNEDNKVDQAKGVAETNGVDQVDEVDDIGEAETFERKLVTVRRVTAVNRVNKSHDVATIDGWKVVFNNTKKIERGNWVLFFEADAFLPADTEFDHLFSEVGPVMTFNKQQGYRVGTSTWIDYRKNKIISQGHIFPLSETGFPDINEKVFNLHSKHHSLTEEQFGDFIRRYDFSNELGVKKWEAFPDKAEDAKGILAAHPKPPAFILKTAMERVQNCPNLFTKPKYKKFTFQESVKMDGATMTIYFVTRNSPYFSKLPPLPTSNSRKYSWNDTFSKFAIHPNGRLGVCSRNLDLLPHLIPVIPDPAHRTQSVYWSAALSARLHDILPRLNKDIAIQAELVGSAIQGNPYSYPAGKHELFVFSIIDIATLKRWSPYNVEQFADDHDLTHVPVLGYYKLPEIAGSRQDLIDRAELKKGEGLVFKNCDDGRWFKVLSNRWILEKDEVHALRYLSRPNAAGTGTQVAAAAQTDSMGEWSDWIGECGPEEIEKIKAIMVSLVDWMQREDGLKKWVTEWQQGMHRQKEKAQKRAAAAAAAATTGGRASVYSADQAREDRQWLRI